jgi:ankyrin repeat protein
MKRLFVYLPLYIVFACLYFNFAAPDPLKYYNKGASVRTLRLEGVRQARKPLFSHDLTRMALLETREEPEGDYVHKEFAAVIYRVDGEKAEECARIDLGDEEDFQWGSDNDTIVSFSLYGAHVRRISSGEALEVHYHGLENWSEDYRRIERLADGASVSPKWTYLILGDRLLRRVEGAPAKEEAESEEAPSCNDWNAEPPVRQDYEVLGKLKGGEGPSYFAFDESAVYVADKYYPASYALPSLKILSEGDRAVFAVRESEPAFVFIEGVSTTFVDGAAQKVIYAEYPFNTDYLSNQQHAVIQPDGRIWMGSLGSLTTALPNDIATDTFLFDRPGETIEPCNAFIKAMKLDGDGHTLRLLFIPDEGVLNTIDLDVAKTQLQSGFERIATRHLWVSFLAALPATALVFFFEKRVRAALASFFGIFPWLFRELPYLLRERLRETLHEACRTGDLRAAKRLSRWPLGGRRMKKRNSAGLTPLMAAVGSGHTEIALLLLRRGAEINAADPTGMTALHLACSKAQYGEVAKALVEGGADLSGEWKGCARPARLAAESGNLAALQAMVKKARQVLGLADSDGVTPVLAAAEHGNADAFRLCAEAAPQSLKVARTEDGATAVYLAAKHGMEESLAIAARLAPDSFTIATREGSTPAMAAASKGLVACLGVISKAAPETLGICDEKGVTPALLSAQDGNAEALALIASFAMDSLGKPRSADNVTPAYAAAFNGHGACMEIVAKAAPQSLRVKNKEGFAPAAVAAQNGHPSVLKTIFAHDPGAFAEPPTPAYVAAQFGRVDCVRFLLENAPASFAVADETGSLPLHVAAVAAREEIYRMIVEKFPEMRTHRNNAGADPESILAQALEIRRAEEEKQVRSRAASTHSGGGIVLWGIGFRPNEDMLKSAIVTAGRGNMAAWLVLGSLPHVLDSMDETPSEIEAYMRYDRIAKNMGWKSLTPKYQFLGLADGRKLIMAFPPVI